MRQSLSVSGVGIGSRKARWKIEAPVVIKDINGEMTRGDFAVAAAPQSNLPALLGLLSIESKRGLIDTFSGPPKLYFCGPGGCEIVLSPGSRMFLLAGAPSGHLILPTSEFEAQRHGRRQTDRENACRSLALRRCIYARTSIARTTLVGHILRRRPNTKTAMEYPFRENALGFGSKACYDGPPTSPKPAPLNDPTKGFDQSPPIRPHHHQPRRQTRRQD
jgi:hypothetical protein